MYIKCVQFLSQPVAIGCDGICSKAWGSNSRPRVQLSDDENDYEYLADHELNDAPFDPGIYVGDCAKPIADNQRLNKWCIHECERIAFVQKGQLKTLPNFGVRISNKLNKT